MTAINVKSGATAILSNAVVKAGMINIGEAGGAGKLVRGGAVDFTINNGVDTDVAFGHANSLLEFRNTDGGADHTVTLHGNLAGAGDNEARIRLNSTGAGQQLIIDRNAAETIGVSAVNRVKELIADGTATTTINPQTFAKVLSLGGNTGVVNFINGLDMGSGSTVNVNQNATLQGDITNTGGGITINLGQNTLTYNQGTAAFIGAVVINTTVNPGIGIGNIVVDANGGPTRLNLGAATGITVNLNGASNIADIGQAYQLLTLANGGAITPPPGGVATVLNNNDAAAPQPVWAYNAATGVVSNPAPAVAPGGGGAPAGGGAPIVAPGGGGAPVAIVPAGGGVPVVVPNLNQNINIEITELNDNNSNAYVNYILDNGNIKAVSNVREGLREDFSTTNPGIVEAFANIDTSQDSDARDVVNELGILSTTDPVRQQDAANRLSVVAPAEALANLAIEVVQAAQSSISSRIDNPSYG